MMFSSASPSGAPVATRRGARCRIDSVTAIYSSLFARPVEQITSCTEADQPYQATLHRLSFCGGIRRHRIVFCVVEVTETTSAQQAANGSDPLAEIEARARAGCGKKKPETGCHGRGGSRLLPHRSTATTNVDLLVVIRVLNRPDLHGRHHAGCRAVATGDLLVVRRKLQRPDLHGRHALYGSCHVAPHRSCVIAVQPGLLDHVDLRLAPENAVPNFRRRQLVVHAGNVTPSSRPCTSRVPAGRNPRAD